MSTTTGQRVGTSRASKILLGVSAGIYAVGFFVAYALGPLLTDWTSGSSFRWPA